MHKWTAINSMGRTIWTKIDRPTTDSKDYPANGTFKPVTKCSCMLPGAQSRICLWNRSTRVSDDGTEHLK